MSYSQFQTFLKEGRIADIAMSVDAIGGKLMRPLPNGRSQFITTRVNPDLAKDLEEHGVSCGAVIEGTWLPHVPSWVTPAEWLERNIGKLSTVDVKALLS